MKAIFLVIFFIITSDVFSQIDDSTVVFVNQIIDNETIDGRKTALVSRVNRKQLKMTSEVFLDKEAFTFYRAGAEPDSITLSKQEKKLLIESLKHNSRKEWMRFDLEGIKVIPSDSMMNYLKSDKNNSILQLSYPIFLRQDKLAFAFYLNLTGSFGGYINLTFYRKEEGIWKRWISVYEGAY